MSDVSTNPEMNTNKNAVIPSDLADDAKMTILPGWERQIIVTIPAADIKKAYQAELKDASKKAQIEGFRPGKVPFRIVERRVGPAVYKQTVDDLLNEQFKAKVKKLGVDVLDIRNVEWISGTNMEEDHQFKLNFELFPEFEFNGLRAETVDELRYELSEEDLEKSLKVLEERFTEWNTVDRAATAPDRVKFDYKFRSGEQEEAGGREDVVLQLDKAGFLPGFNEQLIGLAAGAAKQFTLQVPDDFSDKSVAGQNLNFDVTIKEVQEAKPLSREDIAEKVVDERDVEKLKTYVSDSLRRLMDYSLAGMQTERVFKKLAQLNTDLPVPQLWVNEELKRQKQQAKAAGKNEQADDQPHEHDAHDHAHDEHDADHVHTEACRHEHHAVSEKDELDRKQAEERVRFTMLLSKAIQEFKLKVEPEEIEKRIDTLIEFQEDESGMMEKFYRAKWMQEHIGNKLLEEKVAYALLQDAQKNPVKIEAADLFQQFQRTV